LTAQEAVDCGIGDKLAPHSMKSCTTSMPPARRCGWTNDTERVERIEKGERGTEQDSQIHRFEDKAGQGAGAGAACIERAAHGPQRVATLVKLAKKYPTFS